MRHGNRRDFLGTIAVATAALAAKRLAPLDAQKLQIGVIGVGWYGMVDAKAALKSGGCEIAAICDVDRDHLAASADELEKLQGRRPRTFKLYQDLLEAPGPRRRDHRHAAALARPAVHRRPGKGAGRLLREADRLRHPRRPGHGRRGPPLGPHRADRLPAPAEQGLPRGEGVHCVGRGGPDRPGRRADPLQRRAQGPHAASPARRRSTGTSGAAPDPRSPTAPRSGTSTGGSRSTSGHGHLVDWGIHLVDACRFVLGLPMPRRVTAAGGLYCARRQNHDPGHAHRAFRVRPPAARLAAPHLGRRRVSTRPFPTPSSSTARRPRIFASDSKWTVIPRGQPKERRGVQPSRTTPAPST